MEKNKQETAAGNLECKKNKQETAAGNLKWKRINKKQLLGTLNGKRKTRYSCWEPWREKKKQETASGNLEWKRKNKKQLLGTLNGKIKTRYSCWEPWKEKNITSFFNVVFQTSFFEDNPVPSVICLNKNYAFTYVSLLNSNFRHCTKIYIYFYIVQWVQENMAICRRL